MSLNWLDIILLVILGVTVILGLIKGLIRQIFGILTVVAGLILAVLYYSAAASFFQRFGAGATLSKFLGFLMIFFVILILGWVVSRLFSKLMKGPLKFLNHVLGGVFGLVKGILITGILVFAMLVFPVHMDSLRNSSLAPVCLKITRAVFHLIPSDLRKDFNDAYKDFKGRRKKDVQRV